MNFEYSEKIIEIIKEAEEKNLENIKRVAELFAKTIEEDKIIHCFGTGHSHMLGIELFARAGGLGNVDAMLDDIALPQGGAQRSCALEKVSGLADKVYDNYKIEKGDIMVITSNSGRNAVPIEMAMRCKKEGITCVALTNLEQSKSQTSRHPSGKKLYELADVVIDTCVPEGDASMNIEGVKTGPASSIVTMYLADLIACEAIKIVRSKGIKPYVFQSQNVDGYNNDDIYTHYEGRIKHY